MEKKKILLIATGGTIASRPGEDGLSPALTSGELLQCIPEVEELCRIDTALTAFDGFLREFVGFLDGLPDAIQTLIPQTTPTQYKAVQEMIGTQLQRLAEHRLHLSIESNTAQQQANTAAKNEKVARTAKRKKEARK